MKMIKYFNFYLLPLLFLLIFNSGCQTIKVRGQLVDENNLKKIQETKLTKSEVMDLIGTPSIISESNPDIWYYIQRTMASRAWGEPKILNQQMIEILFDKNGFLDKVILSNDTNIDTMKISSEYTKTKGTELNPIQKFIRGIGKFNKTTDNKKKK